MSTKLTISEESMLIVDKFDTFLFDCDGVIWNGNAAIDGVIEVIQMLRVKGKKIIYITNTSALSREALKRKFDALGVSAEMDEIFSGGYAAAVYISSILKLSPTDKVYLMGMSGAETELAAQGISWLGGSQEDNLLGEFDLSTFQPNPNVKVVLFAKDTSINYTKLSKAFQYITDGSEFLCIGKERLVPGKGRMNLASGYMIAAMNYVLGRDPIVIGKPGQTLWDCIRAKHVIDPAKTIIVGDNLETDVAFGKKAGIATMLTMSGATTEKMLSETPLVQQPDYIVNSLEDFSSLKSMSQTNGLMTDLFLTVTKWKEGLSGLLKAPFMGKDVGFPWF